VERARELVSLGARKIIIGSTVLRDSRKKGEGKEKGEFLVNIPILESLVKKIGRERVIVAIDARDGEILVDGWQTPTGLELIETAKTVEPFAGELLFTCVEREGTLMGINMDRVRQLRKAVSCSLTVAGGVSTLDEIETIAALGCDVQLGMALYTGKISLADAFIRSLNWKKGESPIREEQTQHSAPGAALGAAPHTTLPPLLLPVIAQAPDGQVLMTGYTGPEALSETFKRGNLCFHSRSRNRLWMKGEASGNTLRLIRLRADCDKDALLAITEPAGPVCHTGAWSCFSNDRRYTWEFLQSIIAERFQNPGPGSYTATLDNDLVREKIQEEAEELCTAKTRDEVIWEAADLLYFATVLMTREEVTVAEVLDELDRRHKK
jgi:phosphoribosyl-ATP pyrophosphohydrolase/phosphoribosyl-AMP cyclohydrolase